MIEERIQRSAFEVVSLHRLRDSNYWLTRDPIERIEAIEFMRKAMFGSDRVSERLQRVLTVAPLKADLLRNKRSSGRHKDLDDVEMLEKDGGA